MSAQPVVSAIVTSYNHERYVERAVASALAQDVEGLEVIVVDDASTDGTRRALDRGAGDPRLRIEIHRENLGISRTFNHGLALARGEFVAFLGSDDYWFPGHLAEAVDTLREHGAALSYARVELVDAEDRIVTHREDFFGSVPDDEFLRALLRRSNFVPFVSAVMRRDVAAAVGGFDERLVTLQDHDLWVRLAARHRVRFRDRTVAAFRWDGRNTSRRSAENSLRARRELAMILERCLRERPGVLQRADVAKLCRRRLASTYRRLGRRVADPAERVRCYRASLRCDARQPQTFLRLLAATVRASYR